MRPPSTSAAAWVTAASRIPEIVTDAREITRATASSMDLVEVPVSSTTFSTIIRSSAPDRGERAAGTRLRQLGVEAPRVVDLAWLAMALRRGERLTGDPPRVVLTLDEVIGFRELEPLSDPVLVQGDGTFEQTDSFLLISAQEPWQLHEHSAASGQGVGVVGIEPEDLVELLVQGDELQRSGREAVELGEPPLRAEHEKMGFGAVRHQRDRLLRMGEGAGVGGAALAIVGRGFADLDLVLRLRDLA